MKKVIPFIVCCCFVSLLWSQDYPLTPPTKCDANSYGYAVCLDTAKVSSKQYAFKIIYPKWGEKTDTIFNTADSVWVTTKEAACYWKFRNIDRNCLSYDTRFCVSLSSKDISAAQQLLLFEENEIFKTIETQRLLNNGRIEMIDTDTFELKPEFEEIVFDEFEPLRFFKDENDRTVYVFPKQGKWLGWRQWICGNHSTFTVDMIQSKLKKLGYYKGEVDNMINDAVKDALIKFQQDYNLSTGNLDYKTINTLFTQKELQEWREQLNFWE